MTQHPELRGEFWLPRLVRHYYSHRLNCRGFNNTKQVALRLTCLLHSSLMSLREDSSGEDVDSSFTHTIMLQMGTNVPRGALSSLGISHTRAKMFSNYHLVLAAFKRTSAHLIWLEGCRDDRCFGFSLWPYTL